MANKDKTALEYRRSPAQQPREMDISPTAPSIADPPRKKLPLAPRTSDTSRSSVARPSPIPSKRNSSPIQVVDGRTGKAQKARSHSSSSLLEPLKVQRRSAQLADIFPANHPGVIAERKRKASLVKASQTPTSFAMVKTPEDIDSCMFTNHASLFEMIY